MKKKMVNIVAPNRFRFVKYCDEIELTPGVTARMISKPDDVFGISGPVDFAPGFHTTKGYHEIEARLKRKALMGDVTLPDWWWAAGERGAG